MSPIDPAGLKRGRSEEDSRGLLPMPIGYTVRMTRKLRFIHAADFHLGAPTRGLAALTEEWATRLQTAIPEAYDRVIEAAIAREVDFVVIAGDVFDSSSASYCDYLHFFEGLEKLHEAGIPVYLVAGNHDPYTSWARNIVRLPESAHMMGVGVPTFELFERDGEPLCLIGGRSYYAQAWPLDEGVADGITRQNAIGALSEKHPRAAEAPFSIGIIHTGLDLDASKAAVDERTLLAQDIDYWACGHLHRRLVRPIVDDPRIVFPGCIQGRDIKESGERGCYLVELEENASPNIEFIPTASVSFHSLDIDVSGCQTLSDVERTLKVELFRENGHDYCSEMVAHVNLVGETALHAYLRQPDVIASARKRVNDACPGFFCDAIVDCTSFPKDGSAEKRLVDTDAALIDYVQSTLVQRGIAVPDALGRRIGEFRVTAQILTNDLLDERGEGLDADAAREEVACQLAVCTDRESAEAANRSIYQLGDALEAKYIEVRRATEQAAACRQDDRELHELVANKKNLSERACALADEVEDLTSWHDQLEVVDEKLAASHEELDRLRDSAAELTVLIENEAAVNPRLLGLTTQDDRALRDKLEEYATEREKLTRAIDDTKDRSDTSSAAYEALQEIDEDATRVSRLHTRTAQIVVSTLLPVAFMVAGIPAFIHGRQIGSLSFTVFGIGMVVLAFFLAAAAIVVLFRPGKDADALENRRQDAHWVMLQDKKLLEARTLERDELDAEMKALLERYGLESAEGSVRQAMRLLDDAQEARARMAEQRHRAMAHEMHESAANQTLAELELQRRALEEEAGLEENAPIRALESQLRSKEEELSEVQTTLENTGKQIDALTVRLDRAKGDRSFDCVKLDYHQIRARLRVAKHDYITLLLAQRLLEE